MKGFWLGEEESEDLLLAEDEDEDEDEGEARGSGSWYIRIPERIVRQKASAMA